MPDGTGKHIHMVYKEQPQAVPPQKTERWAQSVIGVQFTAQMAEDPDAAYTDGSAQNVIGVCAGSKFNINALLAAPCPGNQHGKEKRDPVTVQQCLMLVEQLPQCEVHDNDHCNIQTLGKILYLPDVCPEQHDNETDGKIPFGEQKPQQLPDQLAPEQCKQKPWHAAAGNAVGRVTAGPEQGDGIVAGNIPQVGQASVIRKEKVQQNVEHLYHTQHGNDQCSKVFFDPAGKALPGIRAAGRIAGQKEKGRHVERKNEIAHQVAVGQGVPHNNQDHAQALGRVDPVNALAHGRAGSCCGGLLNSSHTAVSFSPASLLLGRVLFLFVIAVFLAAGAVAGAAAVPALFAVGNKTDGNAEQNKNNNQNKDTLK